ncbi:MAG: class I SAM-dependent methyltransferase [Anaerolineales bacterium]
MRLKPHSDEWYDRLAQQQEGYYYPWKSKLAPYNGEDLFMEMVEQELLRGEPQAKDVLDVGCGHGEVTLQISPLSNSVLAYDRVASFIELAEKAAEEHGADNVRFLHADSRAGGDVRIPAEDASFDLLISRRGPLHWLEDARRVARPGAVILQLNPMETPPPEWNTQLPEALRLPEVGERTMRQAVESHLASGDLALHSCWTFDVPEVFADTEQLYKRLSWGLAPDEAPSYAEVEPALQSIFEQYGDADGLALRFRRFLWKAVVNL